MTIITTNDRLNEIAERVQKLTFQTGETAFPVADLKYLVDLAEAAAIHEWPVCPCWACARKRRRAKP